MYSIRNSKYTFFYIHFHYKPDRQAGQMTGPRVGGGGWDLGSACHELNSVGGGAYAQAPTREPNSPLICQPLVFTFAKETDEFIQCEEKKLRQQIENLPDISFSCGMKEFCLKASSVKVYSTMWDGKSCTSIAKTFLEGKKLASNTCHLCLATPNDMNKPQVWDRPIKIPEMVDYSCTALHMWIRSMEYLFNS